MSDDLNLNWPREIWMAEREEHDQGVVTAVLSEWATVSRWEGDKERDREFHRYVDADIHESADKYWRARIATLEAQLAQARAAGMREAADLFTAHPWSWNKHEIRASILAAIEKGEG